MVVCEVCQYHPATRHVTVVIADGRRRDVAVCDVHRAHADQVGGSEAPAKSYVAVEPRADCGASR